MYQDRKTHPRISIAIIIIVLCFISLIGVTYALFTNGDDGVIGINVASGDIGVDIVDKDQMTLIGDVLNFVGVEGNPNEVRWEPGAVHYTEPFAIKNLGNIPISYRVYIECKDEDSVLLDVLEFYIITESELEAAGGRIGLEQLDESVKMQSFDKYLEAGALSEDYYHLVVRMVPEAGNEYQGKVLNGIGITVYAVQGNVDVSDALPSQTESETVTGTEAETETTAEAETVTETETAQESQADNNQ